MLSEVGPYVQMSSFFIDEESEEYFNVDLENDTNNISIDGIYYFIILFTYF